MVEGDGNNERWDEHWTVDVWQSSHIEIERKSSDIFSSKALKIVFTWFFETFGAGPSFIVSTT